MKTILFAACCAFWTLAAAQDRVPEDDRIRLAEAFRIADRYSEDLWRGWSRVSFAVLLVTPQTEFLLRHPNPSDDFISSGYDSLLGTHVYARPRTYDTGLLATFPAVGGIPTVVVGQAEQTQAKRSSRWVLTVLHEHFHQLQQRQPDYHESVNALELHRGDESGMWMLTYPFPYDSAAVQREYAQLAKALHSAVVAPEAEFSRRLEAYLSMRAAFKKMLDPDDHRYFTFQLWQEGVSRYTELTLAHTLSLDYRPTNAFQSLPDFRSFNDEYAALRKEILSDLLSSDLGERQRSAFYSFGASEALLLDRTSPKWRQDYFPRKFSLESLFPAE